MPSLDLDRLIAGWRGPVMAALVALVASLPGLIAMPALDRTEARFMQASVQMLESRELAEPRFQNRPIEGASPLVHYLQAGFVAALSSPEAREPWAYRLVSLLAAMLAAAGTVWGARFFWGGRAGLAAGVALAASFLLSTEGFLAKADALLCALVVLAMTALARMYAAQRAGGRIERRFKLLFWIALALSIMVKGPLALLIAGAAAVTLAVWDRKAAWLKDIGWGWGAVVMLAALGPWTLAITVATDAAYWPQLLDTFVRGLGLDGRQAAPPGAHALMSPLLFFPGALLMVAAAITAWKRRDETGVRVAIAWLVPAWIAFELVPAKPPHYVLPLYPAMAWLVAAALHQNLTRIGLVGGTILSALTALIWSGAAIWLLSHYGSAADQVYVSLAVGFLLVGVFVGAWFMAHREVITALMLTSASAVLAHAALTAGLGPQLKPLWPARNLERALDRLMLDPRDGLIAGPVAIAGFREPSVVFTLGTDTELADAEAAADAVAEGRPAVVEARQVPAFLAALAKLDLQAEPAGEVKAYDYVRGRPISLTIYRPRRTEGDTR